MEWPSSIAVAKWTNVLFKWKGSLSSNLRQICNICECDKHLQVNEKWNSNECYQLTRMWVENIFGTLHSGGSIQLCKPKHQCYFSLFHQNSRTKYYNLLVQVPWILLQLNILFHAKGRRETVSKKEASTIILPSFACAKVQILIQVPSWSNMSRMLIATHLLPRIAETTITQILKNTVAPS